MGTIDQDEGQRFKRMVFRATKGNAFCEFSEIDANVSIIDPKSKK